jgi:hypothetical protein
MLKLPLDYYDIIFYVEIKAFESKFKHLLGNMWSLRGPIRESEGTKIGTN